MARLIALAAVLLSVSVHAGPKAGRKPAPLPVVSVNLNPASWSFLFSSGVPSHPYPLVGQPGWYFDLPVLTGDISQCWAGLFACPQVDYLLAPHTVPITASNLVITARVVVTSGAPVFNFKTESGNTCTAPASVRALVWYSGDNGMMEFGRWWSNPGSIRLDPAAGVVTISIPITPDQWSSVYGKRGNADATALAGWRAAFASPKKVGLTFGGGCFFGHGVNVSGGTAQFVLLDYSFQ